MQKLIWKVQLDFWRKFGDMASVNLELELLSIPQFKVVFLTATITCRIMHDHH